MMAIVTAGLTAVIYHMQISNEAKNSIFFFGLFHNTL